METLPNELLFHIFQYVEWSGLANLAGTCARFADIVLLNLKKKKPTHCSFPSESENTMLCPYDPSHGPYVCVKMHWHLSVCRTTHSMGNILVDCPISQLHSVPILESVYHSSICSDWMDTKSKLEAHVSTINFVNCMHGPPISVKDDTLYVSTPTQELWFQIGTKDRKSFLTQVEKPSFTPKVIKRKKNILLQ
jgi:hypothetical protein